MGGGTVPGGAEPGGPGGAAAGWCFGDGLRLLDLERDVWRSCSPGSAAGDGECEPRARPSFLLDLAAGPKMWTCLCADRSKIKI